MLFRSQFFSNCFSQAPRDSGRVCVLTWGRLQLSGRAVPGFKSPWYVTLDDILCKVNPFNQYISSRWRVGGDDGEQSLGMCLSKTVCVCVCDRETERQRDRETERQRDRETERQRDRVYVCVWLILMPHSVPGTFQSS